MKKENIKATFIRVLVIIGILSLLIPFLIHILFRAESPEGSFFIAKWDAGDMLSYCGSIIGSIIVVITVWYTLKSSNDDTRKTIEASRKQFSIDLAINTFMEYIDCFGIHKLNELFDYRNANPQEDKIEREIDYIRMLTISIIENKDKAYFYLTDDEKSYLGKEVPEADFALNSLEELSNFDKEFLKLESQKPTPITSEYIKQLELQGKRNKALFKNVVDSMNDANGKLLHHFKIIINKRLQDDELNISIK